MINHCPKCSYSRTPSDVAPATECPSCGVIFEKFLAAVPRQSAPSSKASRPQRSLVSAVPTKKLATGAETKNGTIANCPTCAGTVAFGAKTCPHCGMAKPAPKPPTQVTKTHLLIAGSIVLGIFATQSNPPRRLGAEEVTKLCAGEAGLDVNSTRPVTMQDLRIIDACVNRYGYKTKQ